MFRRHFVRPTYHFYCTVILHEETRQSDARKRVLCLTADLSLIQLSEEHQNQNLDVSCL